MYNLSYVHLFSPKNERNGSLIDESGSAQEDPLGKVRTILKNAYSNPACSNESIKTIVHQTASAHSDDLGHLAEFWLLLAVGEVFAHPRQTYGHNAGAYRSKAKQCSDITSDLVSNYITLIEETSSLRTGRSDIQTHIAVKFAKEPFEQLKRQLAFSI
ncbi:MAG TPA: hypothetical protein VGO98_02555 [Candidatus Saccharimonadales bacterium]|nr:hypothetical protein [Candidatus Saccharimonadales bacterium]